MEYKTRFGALDDFQKGTLEIINDDPKHYVFSNIFDVASRSKPYEKVAVGKNMEYVLEAVRAEGTSEWRTCSHDEFALVMDGEVEVRLVKLETPIAAAGKSGSIRVDGEPQGRRMGRVIARRGHMTLLPAGAAYQLHADVPSTVLLQTIQGDDTIERWADICES
jgi:hypothetical protein